MKHSSRARHKLFTRRDGVADTIDYARCVRASYACCLTRENVRWHMGTLTMTLTSGSNGTVKIVTTTAPSFFEEPKKKRKQWLFRRTKWALPCEAPKCNAGILCICCANCVSRLLARPFTYFIFDFMLSGAKDEMRERSDAKSPYTQTLKLSVFGHQSGSLCSGHST